MDFPHLGDTEFPILKTENVYAFKNTFNYHRWDKNTIVRLVNVLWDSSLNDAPLFDSNDVRDAWFDSLEDGFALRLETAAWIVPAGFAKVPVPYDVAARYNYLYVEIPVATGDEMIDYEQPYGIRRWYFFIDHIDYGSPNATHVYVTNDFWTTFQNDVTIRYMMLERGHAPVAASSTSEYLDNPLENSGYLLAPDVDFGRGSVVRHSQMIPFGNGTKYVVFASMATRENVLTMGSRTGDGTTGVWTAPTYSDSEARDGHDMVINGYVWGNGYDYSSLRTTIDNNASNADRLPNNVTCWAIPADKCYGFEGDTYYDSFLVKLARECPSFLQTILGMFMVDESMLSFNYDPVTICGETLRYCRGTRESAHSIDLDKSMFAYPDRYERFAKLYTFPYALMELTDNDGQTVSVRIEDTGEITYRRITSLAFPFLDMRVLFEGIGGSGHTSMQWTNLVDEQSRIDIGSDDWGSIKFDWPIPTYGLYMDGESAYNLRNWGNLKNARIDAVSAYHASMRDANCAENNAIALAQTAESNATDTANTHQANENDNADTLVANTANTCNAQTANTALTVATNTANVALGNNTSTFVTALNNGLATANMQTDNTLMVSQTAAQNEASIATTANNATATIASGTVNAMSSSLGQTVTSVGGEATGAGLAMTSISAAAGALSGYLASQSDKANAVILTQVQTTLANSTGWANAAKVSDTNNNNDNVTDAMNDLKTDQNDNTNDCITQQTANNVAAATNNAANTSATIKGNATRTRDTAVGNAARTRGTTVSNAGYSQIGAERTAKELLEAAQRKAKNSFDSARNQMPSRIGETTGKPDADYFRTRGVQVKVRTESESAIAQAGDHFARYGYALNRMWDVDESGFCPMRKFCYWKASDIWVDDRLSSTSDASKAIQRMFLEGVTLWKNPNEIGRVSVYDN